MNQISGFTETQLYSSALNPVQVNLRRALELLDGGKNHLCGDYEDRNGRLCMWGAVNKARGSQDLTKRQTEHDFLEAAVFGQGICNFNNTCSWPNIEAAFYRAIDLAA